MSYVRNYSVDDGDEIVDEVYTQFYSRGGGGVFSIDENKRPYSRKVSRHVKISDCLGSEIKKLLKVAHCPICGNSPDPKDTLIYLNPNNDQASWLCNPCSVRYMIVNGKKVRRPRPFKWLRWNRLPAFKRNKKTSATDNELYNTIVAHDGQNIKTLACILGWSYGKTRGACMRLADKNHIRIEKSHNNNYYETKIYIIT